MRQAQLQLLSLAALVLLALSVQPPSSAMQGSDAKAAKTPDVLTAGEKAIVMRSDGRDRVKSYFQVTSRRFLVVRDLVGNSKYADANKQIEDCGRIYDQAFEYIDSDKASKKKKTSWWKQMERDLNEQIRFLESLLRDFPYEFSAANRTLIDHAKDLRIRCLTEIFGPNILKNPYDDEASGKKPDSE